jgi:hypothetical protein
VFSKEATHGNVAMLERLHRQLRGYAPGGLVQRHAAPVVIPQGGGGVSIDYDRLAGAMSRVAPLYGQVNMQPHNYGEFQRQMLQDRQAAGLGGI